MNGMVMIFVKLEQILHLKVGCSDIGTVQDRGSLPYLQNTYPSDFSVTVNVEVLWLSLMVKHQSSVESGKLTFEVKDESANLFTIRVSAPTQIGIGGAGTTMR